MKTILYWHAYKYFPYEKELAKREVRAFLRVAHVKDIQSGIEVEGNLPPDRLRLLVYFSNYTTNGSTLSTLQRELEQTCAVNGLKKRQSTRYSVHGLHEYKGKFNPQVVRGVLNALGTPSNAIILDPFTGSGTSLVECAQAGMTAIGCDINPLAVFITNAKLSALRTPAQMLRHLHELFLKQIEKSSQNNCHQGSDSDERGEYLQTWFNGEILSQIEAARAAIQQTTQPHSNIFLALASDLLRDYSLQEPADLRIRKRFSPMPKKPFWSAYRAKVEQFLTNLEATQQLLGTQPGSSYAVNTDSRNLDANALKLSYIPIFDAVITSPPYATALPYIDTQRLSLVWLGLLSPNIINSTEAALTGSREFYKRQKSEWKEACALNTSNLPSSIIDFCKILEKAIAAQDGFRRRVVPILLYRYLSDMKKTFQSVLPLTKIGRCFALIVGHNRTTLGGKLFDIDTPKLLQDVAVSCGWQHVESTLLQTYQRYDLHSVNAIQAETLLVLQRHD